jgi:hypothetical protein
MAGTAYLISDEVETNRRLLLLRGWRSGEHHKKQSNYANKQTTSGIVTPPNQFHFSLPTPVCP